jgi:bifunctional non-homologous end joining protein LigD
MSARTKSPSESAKAVDRQLARYRAMRDFETTSEPRGGTGTGGRTQSSEPMPFVVQKHAARQLHYDFRLGWRGVLKSWAVAKGPSYFTGDKRLAVEVEDHPMEYGGFEGTIPKGQYGGGTVMVWDYGEWQPLGDVDKDLQKGDLKFLLHGTKLKGKWVLVRMRPNRDRDRSDKPNWLLIKEKDEYAQPQDTPAVIELAPNSAITGRMIEQIAESQDHVWEPKHGLRQPADTGVKPSRERKTKTADKKHKSLERLLQGTPLEDFPGFISPQLAGEARSAPNGADWVHELKFDGYRTQVHVQTNSQSGGKFPKARLLTRKGLDWTARMTHVAQAAAELGVESAILDGEIVALDSEGRSSFSDLQSAFQDGKQADLTYFAFDLLHLSGHNLRGLPLLKRKTILAKLLAQSEAGSTLRLCEHIQADGATVFTKACELGAEGIVSKLSSAPYTSGRGNGWIKLKCKLQQEFVVGGFTQLAKGGQGIGALLLGYYEDGRLCYAGRCGTGFTREVERTLRIRLDALVRKGTAFAAIPPAAMQNARWVRPDLVAQVAFAAWSKDNQVLRASFKSLREDKPPADVIRESPMAGVTTSIEASEPVQRTASRDAAAPHSEKARPEKTHPEKPSTLAITRPNKVLDEESGTTKLQLAEYYAAVAERMLPHIADRPLSVLRCPNGVGNQCFFQKHVSPGLPAGIGSVSIANKKTNGKKDFLTLNSADGLIGLAQLGVLEIHPWGSKNDSLERPDRIIFDLDPDEAITWPVLAAAALELRSQLKQLNFTSFLKGTGGKGLHVVLPIEPEYEWPVIKQFSRSLVQRMEKSNPGLYITNMVKAARKNRIYLDYLRNDREATAIAPFSTRARAGVPVAVTLDWKELKAPVRSAFHVSDFASWKSRLRRDPWKGITESRQRLTPEILRSVGVKMGT